MLKLLTKTTSKFSLSLLLLTSPLVAEELEVIEVSALRKTQNLQVTPVSVSALSNTLLENAQVNGLNGIDHLVPGLSIGLFNIAQPQIFIRGIGSNDDGAAGDPSIAIYMDDVYMNKLSSIAIDTFDIQRIEVLKGPQGALYGKNGAGGAIHIINNRPEFNNTAKFQLGLGNFNFRTANLMVNKLVTNDQAVRLSLSRKVRGGYVTSAIQPELNFNQVDNMHARLQYLAEIDSDQRLGLAAFYVHDSTSSPGHIADGGAIGHIHRLVNQTAFNHFYKNFATHSGHEEREASGFKLDYQTKINNADLIVIASHNKADVSIAEVIAGSSIQVNNFLDVTNFIEEQHEQTSIEARLSGAFNHFEWMLGASMQDATTNRVESLITYLGTSFPQNPTQQVLSLPADSVQYSDNRSSAIYAAGGWNLDDVHKLHLGSRYSYDAKKVDLATNQVDQFTIFEQYDTFVRNSFSEWTHEVNFSSQWQQNIFSYLRYSEGFKSGGFQGMASTKLAAETGYLPEYSTNYEMGLKLDWFSNQLRTNLSIFTTQYQDLQVQKQVDVGALGYLVVENAAKANIKGAELDWTFRPSMQPKLELSGNYAYLDTEYENYADDPRYQGNKLRNAPKTSYSIRMAWYERLSFGQLSFDTIYSYKGKTYQDPENLESSIIPSYHLTHFNLKLSSHDTNYFMKIWVENAFNQKYFIHKYASPTGIGSLVLVNTPGAPRQYGITFGVNW